MGQQIVDPFPAMQYLTWAIEEIDKIGHLIAARHARNALAELKRAQRGFSEARNDHRNSE